MEECINGGCTKEGKSSQSVEKPRRKRNRTSKPASVDCAVCGVAIPQTSGKGKTRFLCSSKCKDIRNGVTRKPAEVPCENCGKPIAQKRRGATIRRCSKECRRESATTFLVTCARCGEEFTTPDKRKIYCSRRCRYPTQIGDPIPCRKCGRQFVRLPKRHGQRYCSRECAKTAPRSPSRRPKTYSCLNCGVMFVKRKANGVVSCRTKYCTRECAFEARRLKKPCARRPAEVASQLARWFLSWGDDYWPHVYKCESCGTKMVQRSESSKKPSRCVKCLNADERKCVDCEAPVAFKFARRCKACAEKRSRKRSKQDRQRKRRLHGHDSTFRARCRTHGAAYTPISKSLIFERDGWTCQLCNTPLLDRFTLSEGSVDPRSPSVDHVFPLSMGADGPGHVHYNVIAACFSCNALKGDLNPQGWSSPLHSFASHYATRIDFKAWLKAQHQLRSTSSRCGGRRKPSTARNLAHP